MLTQVLFHPDHIVPAVKFTAAAIKFSHHAVAKTLVEMYTVPGQILVFYFTGGNAGNEASVRRGFKVGIDKCC